MADFGEPKGREQGTKRPSLIISVNEMNNSPANLVLVIPLTKTDRGNPAHVRISPPEGGLDLISFLMCEQVRCISTDRLIRPMGRVNPATMIRVEEIIKMLFGLK